MEHIGLQWAVDFDVSQQKVLEVRAPSEWDAGQFPHGAVRAIAPREVACARPLLTTVTVSKHAAHFVRAWHDINQLDAAFDHYSISSEVVAEHGFGLGLRDKQDERETGIRRAEVTETHLRAGAALEVDGEMDARVPSLHERLTKAEALEHFEAAGLHGQGARLMHPLQSSVHDAEARTEGPELRGERQPGRAGTNDKDVEQRGASGFGHCLLKVDGERAGGGLAADLDQP
jgi:hypothetical protein